MTTEPHFFGYGSLVNRATQSYPDAQRACLKGWRRFWCPTRLYDRAFLSARPAGEGEIEGLVARVPGADWAALDERERGYARHDVSPLVDAELPVQVYSVTEESRQAQAPVRLLLSYVDVVVQGYLAEFGEAGVARFFETTDGWEGAELLDDRGAPEYPRAQVLTPAELKLVDGWLKQVGVH